MAAVGHSSLLKFLVGDATMSEPANIKSEVPVEQNIRDGSGGHGPAEAVRDPELHSGTDGDKVDQVSAGLDGDWTLEPVITITKREATFSKGGLRLQQVAVTEDIPEASSASADLQNDGETTRSLGSGDSIKLQLNEEKEATDSKQMRTKIPMARLRKTAERVATEIKEKRSSDKGSESMISYCRKSSIPRLRDGKVPQPKEGNRLDDENPTNPNPDDEFDRIFQDMSPTDGGSLEYVSCDAESVSQVEMKFEEIIHDYEERKEIHSAAAEKVKHSKIPLLKRKSEHEIEIPVNRIKNILKKSQSLDTYKEQSTRHSHTRMTRRSDITNETSGIYSKSKTTADKFVLDNLNDTRIPKIYKIDANASKIKSSDTNNNDNAVMTKEIASVTSEISSQQNQEMNEDGNESIDESISAWDLTEVVDDNVKNDTSNLSPDIDDLISETVVSKNLDEYVKFDKETVSKIYKIDFTDNCFDSMESSLKLDEVAKGSTDNKDLNNSNHTEVDAGSISKPDVISADDNIETEYPSTKVTLITSEEIKLESNDKTEVNEDEFTTKKTRDIEELTSTKTVAANAIEIKPNEISMLTTAEGHQDSKYQYYDKQISLETEQEPTGSAAKDPNAAKHEIDDETYKIYSDVFSKLSALQVKEYSEEMKREVDKVNNGEATNSTEGEELNTESVMEEDVRILKGKVSRIIRRISSVDNSKPVEKSEAPKKKSILTKITMFERDEPDEPLPRPEIPKYAYKSPHALATRRQTSAELRRPKVVRELLKDSNRQNVIETAATTVIRTDTTNSVEAADLPDVNEIKTKSNDKFRDEKKESNKGKGKRGEINYKSVRDVINDIEAMRYAEYNVSYERYKVAEKSTINDLEREACRLFEDTNVDNDLKSFVSVEAVSKDNNDILKGSRRGVRHPISNVMINNDERNHYSKMYRNSDFGVGMTENGATLDLKGDGGNLGQVIPESADFSIADDEASDVEDDEGRGEPVDVIDVETNGNVGGSVNEGTKGRARGKCRLKEVKRVTSVAELDLANVTTGRVLEMVTRLNAMEGMERRKREVVNCRERPRKSSVSEKIALFEGRRWPTRTEKRAQSRQVMAHQETSVGVTEEQYAKKIEELRNAKTKYGAVNAKYIELSDSSRMPVMALGTALLDKRIATHLVEAAIEMGFRAIDTASIYGNEEQVGLAINNKISDGTVKREELYIIAKLWSTHHRRDLVEAACRRSLQAMRLAYFDLYAVHNPMSLLEGGDPLPKVANVLQYSNSDYMDAWYGIEDLVRKKLVRGAGISNFNSKQVERVVMKGTLKPIVNQVESHPYLSQEALAGVCGLHGIKLNCYGVLGSKGTPADLKSDLPPAIDDPILVVMAAGLGMTPGQLLVAYQVNSGRSVVVKTTSAAHLHEDLLAQHLQLDASHLSALNSLNRNKRIYTLKGFGETHRHYPFSVPY